MKLYGLDIQTGDKVYNPREDTFFLADIMLKQILNQTIVEVGVGTGTVALALAQQHMEKQFIATDLNINAALLARANAVANNIDLQIVCTNLLQSFRRGAFATVISNPPYLPIDDSVDPYLEYHERLALIGGRQGTEVTTELLQYIDNTAFVILSSLASNPVVFQSEHRDFDMKVIATLPLGLETLWIVRIVRKV